MRRSSGIRFALGLAPPALILAGFALPVVHGSGPLAGRDFTALDLVHVLPGLASTQDEAWRAAGLRLAAPFAVSVAIAAVWHALLALVAPRHLVRRAAGAYLCAAALALAALELWRGHPLPLAGAWAWLLAATLIAAPALARLARALSAPTPLPLPADLVEAPAQRD